MTNRGDVRTVDGLDLSVRRGEILCIAGESGSGKSTLAVALLRLLRPPGRAPADLLKVEGEKLRALR